MNFILRTAQPVTSDLPSVPEAEHHKEAQPTQKRATTLEGLIAEDRFLCFLMSLLCLSDDSLLHSHW